MIVYKWVIKEKNYFKPIINNGAYKPANDIDLPSYRKGKTIKNFINVEQLTEHPKEASRWHIPGFHFWIEQKIKHFKMFNSCMQRCKNTKINCVLKCFVRQKDIILKGDNRIVAKSFRILGEVNV